MWSLFSLVGVSQAWVTTRQIYNQISSPAWQVRVAGDEIYELTANKMWPICQYKGANKC